jgi:hypothetical protein
LNNALDFEIVSNAVIYRVIDKFLVIRWGNS